MEKLHNIPEEKQSGEKREDRYLVAADGFIILRSNFDNDADWYSELREYNSNL